MIYESITCIYGMSSFGFLIIYFRERKQLETKCVGDNGLGDGEIMLCQYFGEEMCW